MPGESPLSMMRTPRQPLPRRTVGYRPKGRLIAIGATIVALAVIWIWLWYYAAAVAERTLAGWLQREAAADRVYSCGSQSFSGFPFGLTVHCRDVGVEVKNTQPTYTARAQAAIFGATIWHPTQFVGDIIGPLTFAQQGQAPRFVANWGHGRIKVGGIPPNPESASLLFGDPRVDRIPQDAGHDEVFKADRVEATGRVIGGAPNNHPVIEVTLHVNGVAAPTLHPLLAAPVGITLDAVARGFADLAAKPWPDRVREMQAAGGGIDLKAIRFAQSDAIVIVGTGTLTVNDHGRVDGVLALAVVGIERIVPLLGIDRLIAQGVDRLSGSNNVLDRLAPGIGGVIRESANATVIESLKKMGQPTSIDGRPAVALPLRLADGTIYLGALPVGQIPSLF
jgi:hypothetical protein